MKYAKLLTTGLPIAATDVRNKNEIFGCLYPNCPGQLKIRSLDGKVSPHFWSAPQCTPHSNTCIYNSLNQRYNSSTVVKSSLDDIFASASSPKTKSTNQLTSNATNGFKNSRYIRTPKQLLSYCINESLDSVYLNNIRVDDIILDYRNYNTRYNDLLNSHNNCLKLIFAHTIRYTDNTIFAYLSPYPEVRDNSQYPIRYNYEIAIRPSTDLLKTAISVILRTKNNKFRDAPIAVFGKCSFDSIEGIPQIIVNNTSCFIYRF